MAFIQDHQRFIRQVIEQGRRRLAGPAARQVAGVVLDAVAVTQLQHHFEVIAGALLQALRLHQSLLVAQQSQPLFELDGDSLRRIQHDLPGRDIVRFRVDGDPRKFAQYLAGQRIENADGIHFLVE